MHACVYVCTRVHDAQSCVCAAKQCATATPLCRNLFFPLPRPPPHSQVSNNVFKVFFFFFSCLRCRTAAPDGRCAGRRCRCPAWRLLPGGRRFCRAFPDVPASRHCGLWHPIPGGWLRRWQRQWRHVADPRSRSKAALQRGVAAAAVGVGRRARRRQDAGHQVLVVQRPALSAGVRRLADVRCVRRGVFRVEPRRQGAAVPAVP